jgi:hypothetical protein
VGDVEQVGYLDRSAARAGREHKGRIPLEERRRRALEILPERRACMAEKHGLCETVMSEGGVGGEEGVRISSLTRRSRSEVLSVMRV